MLVNEQTLLPVPMPLAPAVNLACSRLHLSAIARPPRSRAPRLTHGSLCSAGSVSAQNNSITSKLQADDECWLDGLRI